MNLRKTLFRRKFSLSYFAFDRPMSVFPIYTSFSLCHIVLILIVYTYCHDCVTPKLSVPESVQEMFKADIYIIISISSIVLSIDRENNL